MGLAERLGFVPAGDNHRGVFPNGWGANFVEDFDKLPPSLRFFAGGDNNLRGYEYESDFTSGPQWCIGWCETYGNWPGGISHRLAGNWWGAVFVDGGDTFDYTPRWKRTRTGFGVRWVSPVGPLCLDFAWGLGFDPGEFRIHFSLGPELWLSWLWNGANGFHWGW